VNTQRRGKQALAGEAWRLLVDYFFTFKSHGLEAAKQMDLTPGHLRVLIQLREGEAPPMGSLVKSLQIHASMCTWLIDGLEKRGLVERRSFPGDRRVKTIVLTPEGEQVKARLMDALYEPPPEFAALDRARLEALRGALEQLVSVGRPEAR
jgi:DNA-binding MarR family transcriptional regulator